MMWIINNIDTIVGIVALICSILFAIYNFVKLGKESQVTKIKEWLLFAVVEAEKKLGEGTGQIKLRYVYDMFVTKFKFVQLVVTFDEFSDMVDDSLDIMRGMLTTNNKVKEYVGGEQNDSI